MALPFAVCWNRASGRRHAVLRAALTPAHGGGLPGGWNYPGGSPGPGRASPAPTRSPPAFPSPPAPAVALLLPTRPWRCSTAHTRHRQGSRGPDAIAKGGHRQPPGAFSAKRLRRRAAGPGRLLLLLRGRAAPAGRAGCQGAVPRPRRGGAAGIKRRGPARPDVPGAPAESSRRRPRGGGARSAALVSRERRARAAGRAAAALARAAAPDPTWRKVRGGARARGRAGPRPPGARGAPPVGVASPLAGGRGQPPCGAPAAPLCGTGSALPAAGGAGRP